MYYKYAKFAVFYFKLEKRIVHTGHELNSAASK